jgi:ribulose-bisphosphate carboxylase small chain
MQCYYNNRYWTLWKLPMFGCSEPGQVLKEVAACKRAFPESYVSLVAFDSISPCQTAGFLVSRPKGADDYTHPEMTLYKHY